MALARSELCQVFRKFTGDGGRGARQENRFNSIRVRLTTDVASFAIQGRAKSLSQRGDVVAEKKVRLFSDSEAVDVDPGRVTGTLKYLAVTRCFECEISR